MGLGFGTGVSSFMNREEMGPLPPLMSMARIWVGFWVDMVAVVLLVGGVGLCWVRCWVMWLSLLEDLVGASVDGGGVGELSALRN